MSSPTAIAPLDRGSFAWTAAAAAASLLPLGRFLPAWLSALIALLISIGLLLGLRRAHLPGLLRLALTLAVAGMVLWDYGVAFGARFGRDTGTALLASMVALKLLEIKGLRDARLLASVALFLLIAGFLQDRGPLTLVLAMVATLVVLAALARLGQAETGRVPPARGDVVRQLGYAGRIALYSLPLAIVAFFLFPRLSTPLWGLPENSQESRTGLSDSMSPGDIGELFLDDSPILRVRFGGPPPANPLRYWRGPVLTRFDGRRWTRSRMSAIRPPGEIAIGGAALEYEIQQEPTERHFVLALDMPLMAPPGAHLGADREVLSRLPLNEVSLQRLRSAPDYRLEAQDPPGPELLALPDGMHPRSRALAAGWRAAGADDRSVINSALQLFNRAFTYTLTPPLLGPDSVDDFLFETRAGYCEHFSSSFAVLMRAAGIPTRVVTGYQGGTTNEVGDYLVVRQSDAHAWNEVWLPGEGWLRIDPTAAVAPERIENAGGGALRDQRRGRSLWGRQILDTVDWLRRGWNDVVLGYDAMTQRDLLRPLGVDPTDWRELGLLLVAAVGVALAITLGLLLRRPPDGEDPLGRAWRRFLRRLERAGVGKAAHEGPIAFAERAAAALPTVAEPVATLSRRYAEQRYAADVPDRESRRQLIRELLNFRVTRSKT